MHGGGFARNKAAVISLYVLIAITIFAFFRRLCRGLATRRNRLVGHWHRGGGNGRPSFATGHYFGVDQEGAICLRAPCRAHGCRSMVGLVGSAVAVVVGTLWGAVGAMLAAAQTKS